MPNLNLNLGAQLYTLRDFAKNAVDFTETMKKVAAIGYKYVQVSGVGAGVTPFVIKQASDLTGVKVILTHTSATRIRDNTEEVLADHDIFGCNALGIGGIPNEHSEAGFMKFTQEFAPAAAKIKAAGKVLLYHNHRFEFEKYNGKYGIEIILENTDPDAVKLTFDTYWALSGGVDPAAFIEKYGSRIFCTHIKDMTVINDAPVMTEMLTGNMNFDSVMAASEKAGVKWHFVEQDIVRIDAFESMKISHDNLKARYDMN
jgi:sugar phosphate isomerase/epimerase